MDIGDLSNIHAEQKKERRHDFKVAFALTHVE